MSKEFECKKLKEDGSVCGEKFETLQQLAAHGRWGHKGEAKPEKTLSTENNSYIKRTVFVRVTPEEVNLINKVKDDRLIKYPERKSIPRGEAINHACLHYFASFTPSPIDPRTTSNTSIDKIINNFIQIELLKILRLDQIQNTNHNGNGTESRELEALKTQIADLKNEMSIREVEVKYNQLSQKIEKIYEKLIQ